jgi:GNAT superfamily N-acetyltransferase
LKGGLGVDKPEVKRLLINYKTLEEFQKFKEYGLEELSMLEDLQANIIEDDSNSPFYGIYYGDKLVARMSLYKISGKYDRYFTPPNGYFELWKLEVLSDYRDRNFGSVMVEFAKSFGIPIKTNARQASGDFWLKMGFKPVKYDPLRDRGENPYIWLPQGSSEQSLPEDETEAEKE